VGRGSAGFGLDNKSKRFRAATRRRQLHLAIAVGCLVAGGDCAAATSAAAQERAYFAGGRILTVVDAQSHAVLNTIPLAGQAAEAAVTADGARAYVLFDAGLATVDLRTAVTSDVMPLAAGEDASFYDLAITANGERAVLVETTDGGRAVVWVIDTAQRSLLHGVQVGTSQPDSGVDSLALSTDGTRIYALVSQADDDDGDNASRSLVEIDAQSGSITRSAPLEGTWGSGLAIVGDRVAYVGGADGVSVVDLTTMSVSGSIPVSVNGVTGIRSGSSGQSLFAWSGRNVFILDSQRLQVQRTLTLDASIADLAVRSDGNELYAALSQAPAEIVTLPANAPDAIARTAVRAEQVVVAPAPVGDWPLPSPCPSPTPGGLRSYRAFVASGAALTLSEIDTGSPAVTAVDRYGSSPVSDLIAPADGSALYGLAANGLLEFDPAVGRAVGRIGLSSDWDGATQVAASRDGNTFWLARWSTLARLDRSGELQQITYPFDGEFKSIALSADGRAVWLTVDDYSTANSGQLYVVDPSTLAVLRAVEIYGGVQGVTGGADGQRVYVATGNYSVAVVDASAGRVVATIATTTRASAIALSPDGAFLYVTGDSALSVLDTSALREVASVSLGDGESGGLVAVTPDGQRALVTTNDVGHLAVVDLSRLAIVALLPVGEAPSGLVILPDAWTPPPTPTPQVHRSPGPRRPCLFTAHDAGSAATDGTVSVIDPIQRGVAGSIRVGQWSTDPASDGSHGYDAVSSVAAGPDGTRLYATTQAYSGGAGSLVAVDSASHAVVNRLSVGVHPVGVAITADESRAYVLNVDQWASVSIVDLVDWHLLANIPVPAAFGRVALSGDSRYLYVRRRHCESGPEAPFDCVSALDTATNQLADAIPTSGIDGLFTLSPDGSRLYVDTLFNGAYVLGIADLSSQTVIGGIDITAADSDIAVSPDGHTLLGTSSSDPGTVAIIDVDGRVVRSTLAAGAFPESPVFGPSGESAYVTSRNGGIFELDVAGGRIAHGIATAGDVTDLVASMIDGSCDAGAPFGPSPTIPPTATPTPTWGPPPTLTPVVWDCGQYPNGCVDIEVGTASGAPGSTVQIDVRLSTAGWSVAGLQSDILFGPLFSVGDAQETACRVNPGIDKGSTAFGVLPAQCAAGECTRLRALVLAVDNVAPISDGSVLYTCDVTIGINAPPGTYPLAIGNVGASDPTGQSLPVSGVDGAVRVTVGDSPAAPAARNLSAEAGAGCAISPSGSSENRSAVGAIAMLLAAARLGVRRRSAGRSRIEIGLR
jgi:DNA-binding beta-propeller fold protein YncE